MTRNDRVHEHLNRARELQTTIQRTLKGWKTHEHAHTATLHITQAINILRQMAQEERQLAKALRTCLPRIERWEKANLIGDEGCLWPVETIRAASKTEESMKDLAEENRQNKREANHQ